MAERGATEAADPDSRWIATVSATPRFSQLNPPAARAVSQRYDRPINELGGEAVRRSLIISAAAVALAMTFPAAAGAAPRLIDVGDDFFAPKRSARSFAPGPSCRWTSLPGADNNHNVRQDDRLFSSGAPEDP